MMHGIPNRLYFYQTSDDPGRVQSSEAATEEVSAEAAGREVRTRPGKHTKNDGKLQFLMGKSM